MIKKLSKLLCLVFALTYTTSVFAQLEIECRQPIATEQQEGLCGVIGLEVLPPVILSGTPPYNITSNEPFFFPVGTTQITWFITDATGAFTTCTSLVIVEDLTGPEIGPCNTEVSLTGPNMCVGEAFIDPIITDDCGVVSITGTGYFTYPVGVSQHTVTATDPSGNTSVHVYTIEVHDTSHPEFTFCPENTIDLPDGNFPASFTPMATDNCGGVSITSDLPAGGLPAGASDITFTAEDDYGNESYCVVSVNVMSGISLRPQGPINSSLAGDEDSQVVSWNALDGSSDCAVCADKNLAGMSYVGSWWGHQYFLADEADLTREEAQALAASFDGHLAVINTPEENEYLTNALTGEARSAWIGLQSATVDGELVLAWENGDALEFDNVDFAITEDLGVILTQEGSWENATLTENKYFLLERPCVNFLQIAPELIDAEEQTSLLRSGDVWPQGEYKVTYEVTDVCGNSTEMEFDVNVVPGEAAYCTSAGEDNTVWIEKVIFHNLVSESGDNAGYGDYTEESFEMNIGDGVVLLNLVAGGNEAAKTLYWSVYFDANADGDFFDADELVYQTASAEDVTANIELPVAVTENARLRVVVSKHSFAEPCGDIAVGEIEDYNLTLDVPFENPQQPGGAVLAGVSLSPNPAVSEVKVSLGEYAGQQAAITVYDMFGRARLLSQTDAAVVLNLSGLNSGIYFINVELADGTLITQRLLKD